MLILKSRSYSRYLYWSMDYTIARIFLNGSGKTEVIYKSEDLKNLTGLTIDLTSKYPH